MHSTKKLKLLRMMLHLIFACIFQNIAYPPTFPELNISSSRFFPRCGYANAISNAMDKFHPLNGMRNITKRV